MKTEFECIPCAVNSYLRLAESGIVPEEKQELLIRRLLSFLSDVDYKLSPPGLGREIHKIIRKELDNPDPYADIKEHFNQKMLDLLPAFNMKIENSEDKFDMAMRLAIAGNVIDFGAKYQYDIEDAVDGLVKKEIALDSSKELKNALKSAKSLLYIGDNCGEIVMDKLFLQQIDVPEKYFVVRGGPIINDITVEDAELVGMPEVANVVTTGDTSPGAVWETTSEEFKNLFRNSDVVISKGQGNLEGLIDIDHPMIFFLLVTKCELIGKRIGTSKGDWVVRRGRR